jgi:hypothetical protein
MCSPWAKQNLRANTSDLHAPSEHLGLRVAFGALRPKPLVQHLGLRVAFGALRPKPHLT